MYSHLMGEAQRSQYQPVAQLKSDEDDDLEAIARPGRRTLHTKRRWLIYTSVVACLVITALLLSARAWQPQPHKNVVTCEGSKKRKEWRSLSPPEKQDYIDALLCLMQKESTFETGSSRYDDFAYAHVSAGTITHYAASFLPWHRYFLDTYERALVKECGFRGTLAYWDWTLDASDLAASPIWDNIAGFGGDGNQTSEPELFGGRCVDSGPFANIARYWQAKSIGHGFAVRHSPHCLSRGFQTGEKMKEFQSRITAAAVEIVLSQPSYSEFLDAVEIQAHNAIPQFIRGDFFLMTAPNDPVFFLHHAQVDRLWWMWQQQDVDTRMWQYEGSGENVRVFKNMTHTSSSLDDWISIENLADPMRVKDVISTQSDLLCYRY